MRTRLVNVQTFKTAQVEAVRLEIMYHSMNLLQAAGGEYPTHNVGGNTPADTYLIPVNADGAVGLILARIRAALVQSNRNAVTVREENSTAANDLSLHDSGAGFVYGVTDTDVKSSLFVLDSTRLRTSLASTEIDENDAGPFAFALPCTLRYMFNQQMLSWNVNAALAAAPANATMQNTFWGTSNLGVQTRKKRTATGCNRRRPRLLPFVNRTGTKVLLAVATFQLAGSILMSNVSPCLRSKASSRIFSKTMLLHSGETTLTLATYHRLQPIAETMTMAERSLS